jgi:hypothetical protein
MMFALSKAVEPLVELFQPYGEIGFRLNRALLP